MNKKNYTHRLLARIVVEAKTPLAVGSGEKNMFTDSLVATDVNGLPYIPGTAIAGVLRHAVGKDCDNSFFGAESTADKKKLTGSEIIFTEAKLVGENGEPIDGLRTDIDRNSEFYRHYFNLPIRQHNRIGECGAVEDKGKFDEQIVYKGSRFCFEIEMLSSEADNKDFEQVLQKLHSSSFTLGSGATCGFGEMKVVSCKTKTLDLTKKEDREAYANKSSNLASNWDEWENKQTDGDGSDDTTVYELELRPENFFLFGSGFGDEEADMTPVKECVVEWTDGKPKFSQEQILIPATSVKGAIAHRTAYYYNKLCGLWVDDGTAKVGSENTAVRELFGYADDKGESKKGNVTVSDCYIARGTKDQVVPHVAIDRFTGGTIDSALFQEKTVYGKDAGVKLAVRCRAGKYSEHVQEALEAALRDVCTGLLPLGGGVNRGNGAFKGILTKNGEKLYENQ